MIWEKILRLFGYNYYANLNFRSKEIHYLPNVTARCGLQYLKRGKRLTRKGALRYIRNKGYNGCHHCLKEFDKG